MEQFLELVYVNGVYHPHFRRRYNVFLERYNDIAVFATYFKKTDLGQIVSRLVDAVTYKFTCNVVVNIFKEIQYFCFRNLNCYEMILFNGKSNVDEKAIGKKSVHTFYDFYINLNKIYFQYWKFYF